ncbi:unnamed protein product [Linum trigynum]|uniref:Uncharacterized protein n=1 Tax=Linum trigynum TaxID=586398 RepID=A0AAV2GXD9_9ROSI
MGEVENLQSLAYEGVVVPTWNVSTAVREPPAVWAGGNHYHHWSNPSRRASPMMMTRTSPQTRMKRASYWTKGRAAKPQGKVTLHHLGILKYWPWVEEMEILSGVSQNPAEK